VLGYRHRAGSEGTLPAAHADDRLQHIIPDTIPAILIIGGTVSSRSRERRDRSQKPQPPSITDRSALHSQRMQSKLAFCRLAHAPMSDLELKGNFGRPYPLRCDAQEAILHMRACSIVAVTVLLASIASGKKKMSFVLGNVELPVNHEHRGRVSSDVSVYETLINLYVPL